LRESETTTKKRHIILVRHGQYVFDDDDKKRVLTKIGTEQADKLGQRLAKMESNNKWDKVWISTMTRARETAAIILKRLSPDVPTETSDLIREACPCVPDPNPSNYKPEKFEVFQESVQAEAGYRHIFHRPEKDAPDETHELVVCHGNLIRYWTLRALQLDPTAWLRFSVHNCSLTWITIYGNGKLSVRTIGDFGHLEEENLTFN